MGEKKIRNHYLKVGTKTFDLKTLDLQKLEFKKPFENLIIESMLSQNESICDLEEIKNINQFKIFINKLKYISGLEEPIELDFILFFELFINFAKNFNYDKLTWDEVLLAATTNVMPSKNALGLEIPIIIEKTTRYTTLEFLSLILAKYISRKEVLISKIENIARISL